MRARLQYEDPGVLEVEDMHPANPGGLSLQKDHRVSTANTRAVHSPARLGWREQCSQFRKLYPHFSK